MLLFLSIVHGGITRKKFVRVSLEEEEEEEAEHWSNKERQFQRQKENGWENPPEA